MSMSHDLRAAAAGHKAIVSAIREMFPDESDENLVDTIAGESDFNEQCLALMRLALERESHAEGLAMLIKRMQERKARLESGAEKMRAVVLNALYEAGVKNISGPDMSMSVSLGKAPLIITEPDNVPDELCRVSREPNKTAIAKWLAELDPIFKPEWATWGNPRPKLTVYSR